VCYQSVSDLSRPLLLKAVNWIIIYAIRLGFCETFSKQKQKKPLESLVTFDANDLYLKLDSNGVKGRERATILLCYVRIN